MEHLWNIGGVLMEYAWNNDQILMEYGGEYWWNKIVWMDRDGYA